jgi:leader peptidase (prepilin peptidase)/N-methyltransferase
MPSSASVPALAPVRLDRRTVVVGLVSLVLCGASFAVFGFGPRGLIAAFFAAVLVVLSAVDIERRLLPNRIVLPSAAVVLVAQVAFFPDRALEWLLASVGAALFLFLPLLVRPSGMGMGDVKLALLLGAALGKSVVPGLLIGFLSAVPVSLYLLARYGSSARTRAIPFGPFLAFGSLVALFLEAGEPGPG